MKDYMIFIHSPDSLMVRRVEIVRANSKREALKRLRKMGFKKKRF